MSGDGTDRLRIQYMSELEAELVNLPQNPAGKIEQFNVSNEYKFNISNNSYFYLISRRTNGCKRFKWRTFLARPEGIPAPHLRWVQSEIMEHLSELEIGLNILIFLK